MPSRSLLPALTTIRIIAVTAVVMILAIVAFGGYMLLRDDEPKGQTDQITLAAPATSGPPETTAGVLITHLTLTGGTAGKTDVTVSLSDMKGRPLPINGGYGVEFAATNLNSGASVDARDMESSEVANTPTFTIDEPGLDDDGWWRLTTTVSRPDGGAVASDFYVMLPDPNLAGFDAPPSPKDDPDAAESLETALGQLSQWTSLRWWEWLSGGNDSLIMGRVSVTTTAANGQPPSFQRDMLFAGGFERRTEGAPIPAPSVNHFTSVTIGDQAWNRNAEGEVEETSPTRYLPIDQYPTTYTGATAIQSGISDDVDGRAAHIITFHVPTQPTQSEAWFAFWLDDETGDILKLAMIASNHYMIWVYSDVNADFVIEPPAGATPASTPLATPMS